MTQHTPGPWYCRSNPAQRYPVVFSGETKVARAVTSKLSEHEIEANINSIKAAPDMYEALKLMEKAWAEKDLSYGYQYKLDKARSAISKAEGK